MDRGAMPAAGGPDCSTFSGGRGHSVPLHLPCLASDRHSRSHLSDKTHHHLQRPRLPFLRPVVVLCAHSSASRTGFTDVKGPISALDRGVIFSTATLSRRPGRCGSHTHSRWCAGRARAARYGRQQPPKMHLASEV